MRAGMRSPCSTICCVTTASTATISIRSLNFLARTPSRLLAVSLEDLLGVIDQPNIPGTIDEHPNWRQRLPVALDRDRREGRCRGFEGRDTGTVAAWRELIGRAIFRARKTLSSRRSKTMR